MQGLILTEEASQSSKCNRFGLRAGVWSAEKIPEGLPPKQRAPPPPLMLRPVEVHVTTLAEGREIGICVIGRVVISMGGGQHHLGHRQGAYLFSGRQDVERTALSVASSAHRGILPASVPEMWHALPM